MIMTLEERVAELEPEVAVHDARIESLMESDLELHARIAELEKLVAMMRHAIDVAVLRVEPYPDDSKPAQFLPPLKEFCDDLRGYTGATLRHATQYAKAHPEAWRADPLPDIDDSPFSPVCA